MNSNLFTLKYWFGINAGSLEPMVQKIFVLFLVLLFGLSIYVSFRKRKKGAYFQIWSKLSSFGITNFFIGLFLLFFTYEGLVFLSMRFWFLLWLLVMIFWLYSIYKKFKKIPDILVKRKQAEDFKKYIP